MKSIADMKADMGLYMKFRGPLATVRKCKFCEFANTVRMTSGMGRGAGLALGASAHGAMLRHVRDNHQAEYAERNRK